MGLRTTLVLDEAVMEKLRRVSPNNISGVVNELLKKELFGKGKSMFGSLKGRVSAKDMVEDED